MYEILEKLGTCMSLRFTRSLFERKGGRHGFKLLPGQNLSRRVSRVDNDDSLGYAGLQRLGVGPLEFVHLQGPVALLVQVVADLK